MVKVLRQGMSAIFGIFKLLFDVSPPDSDYRRLGHSGHESMLGGTGVRYGLVQR